MENLVVSIFKTESQAYQAFAELKAFRQTENTKVAQLLLLKIKKVVLLKKSVLTLMIQLLMQHWQGVLLVVLLDLLLVHLVHSMVAQQAVFMG